MNSSAFTIANWLPSHLVPEHLFFCSVLEGQVNCGTCTSDSQGILHSNISEILINIMSQNIRLHSLNYIWFILFSTMHILRQALSEILGM